jgi:hypothetical protein
MSSKVIIEARRETYDMDAIGCSMTVGDLIKLLSEFDENAEVVLSHDNGYTFGGIYTSDFSEVYDVEEDEYEEENN